MNVANLELCKELYELSGWQDMDGPEFAVSTQGRLTSYARQYTLGFLLRKLPLRYYIRRHKEAHADWWAYKDDKIVMDKDGEGILASTPEDAAAKLCIELFKEGILK